MNSKIFLLLILLIFTSCSKEKHQPAFSFLSNMNSLEVGSEINTKLSDLPATVDSIKYYIDGELQETRTDTSTVLLKSTELNFGEHVISAKIFTSGSGGKEYDIATLVNLVPIPPRLFRFDVIDSFPHDSTAYTQGLQYIDGTFYETTGLRGKSTLREVDLATGQILKICSLDHKYFAEGMTVVGQNIIVLTYQENIGFVYDKDTFEVISSFPYENNKEGWGLTYNGKELIKSDGSNILYFLNPETYKEKSKLVVFDNLGPVSALNELEYIEGKIYANVYQKDYIVIIDPISGIVEGKINLIGLYDRKRENNELNGIAYNQKNGSLYVTGKLWQSLFEIKLIEQ